VRPRWRTRWRYWRQHGVRLGKLAERPGTTVSEDRRGHVWITEAGFAHGDGSPYDVPEDPQKLLDQVELANNLEQGFAGRFPPVEMWMVFEYRDLSDG
jgi:hypothetical protein